MLNVSYDVAKKQYHATLIHQMKVLEAIATKKIKPILGQCYMSSARLLEMGVDDSIHVVNNQMPRLRQTLYDHYIRTGTIFSEIIFKSLEDETKSAVSYEIKGMKEDWWGTFKAWITYTAANQVTKVSDTTKKLIKKVILKGIEGGKSYKKIATDLRKIKNIVNPYRASMIARTETHNGMTAGMKGAMNASRMEYESEWHSTVDERTRRGKFNHLSAFPLGANGERIKKGEKYVGTGERMDRPGDPDGSAGNIIHCRCVELFHVIKKNWGKKEPLIPKVSVRKR